MEIWPKSTTSTTEPLKKKETKQWPTITKTRLQLLQLPQLLQLLPLLFYLLLQTALFLPLRLSPQRGIDAGTHTHDGLIYRFGVDGENELDLTEEQAKSLGERVQEVGKEAVKAADTNPGLEPDIVQPLTPPGEPSAASLSGLPVDLAKSIPEVERDLQKVDDIKVLDAVLAAEKKDRDRIGVEKAVNARKEELEAEEAEEVEE